MPAHPSQVKGEQRQAALRRRAELTPRDRRVAEAAIARRLRGLAGAAEVVAAYAAMSAEAGVDELLGGWLGEGRRVALPRVEAGGRLALHRVDAFPEGLVTSTFGIREPPATSPVVEPADVDLALVPGVAFDRDGNRIGHGAGYYDRLLPALVNARLVGVCFEIQVVDLVATEAHDVRLDAVVTEAGVYR